ncbi:hypothetical protein [Ewingella americana]|uniref:Conjugal transfer entry exclusion protein TraS n=1 Tax=Ewingella americana TaxID=41202 RepID=A0A502G5I0_9GAMM|nr:hypothetical protein [Ewingella americana]TPG56811.1 hypothetical protein EAH77_22320 [Ewingella americana]
MGNLTAAQIEADVNFLINGLDTEHRQIPSPTELMKRSAAIPFFSVLLSILSTVIFYASFDKDDASIKGFIIFLISEGWYLLAITAAVGLLVFLMTYNNQLTYMSLPLEVRSNSLLVSHLAKIVRKSIITFCTLMIISCLLSGLSAWFAIAVPVLLLSLFIVSSILVSFEINRLGAGLALEKISKLIKNI